MWFFMALIVLFVCLLFTWVNGASSSLAIVLGLGFLVLEGLNITPGGSLTRKGWYVMGHPLNDVVSRFTFLPSNLRE